MIFFRIPYAGVQGKILFKNLVRKLKRYLVKPFKLRNIYCAINLCHYCNAQDKVPEYLKSHLVYELCCLTYYNEYIDLTIGTRVHEHSGSDKTSAVYNHLFECEHFKYVVKLHSLPPSSNSLECLEHGKFDVCGNSKIIDNIQNRTEFINLLIVAYILFIIPFLTFNNYI